jgi:hypothetical protein
MQRTRKLNAYEVKLVKDYNLQAESMKGRSRVFSLDDIRDAHKQEVAKREAEEAARRAADAEYFTSEEFRQEVIAELMANGASELQATNRTRDQARCFAEARELGLM